MASADVADRLLERVEPRRLLGRNVVRFLRRVWDVVVTVRRL